MSLNQVHLQARIQGKWQRKRPPSRLPQFHLRQERILSMCPLWNRCQLNILFLKLMTIFVYSVEDASQHVLIPVIRQLHLRDLIMSLLQQRKTAQVVPFVMQYAQLKMLLKWYLGFLNTFHQEEFHQVQNVLLNIQVL